MLLKFGAITGMYSKACRIEGGGESLVSAGNNVCTTYDPAALTCDLFVYLNRPIALLQAVIYTKLVTHLASQSNMSEGYKAKMFQHLTVIDLYVISATYIYTLNNREN